VAFRARANSPLVVAYENGDGVVVGFVVLSFLRKKALMSLNSAARELFGITLAPEAFICIV
jgi:hypothetical protein